MAVRGAWRTSVTHGIKPLGKGSAPAPERRLAPGSGGSTRTAAGSLCPEAEALAELASRPPIAMSAFETNPFADPKDVNPFQVELSTHGSV